MEMRHPSLLGNKQPQALSELVGRAQVSVGWERGAVLGSLPGAPFISLRLWTPAGICGSPWVTLRVTVAAPGVCTLVGGGALAECLLVPCVLWGLPPQQCLQLGPSVAKDAWV